MGKGKWLWGVAVIHRTRMLCGVASKKVVLPDEGMEYDLGGDMKEEGFMLQTPPGLVDV